MDVQETKEQTGYPHIDRPWLKFYPKDVIEAPLPDCSMYEYMVKNTKDKDNKYCFNYFGRRISYTELYSQIDKTAAALTNMGLKKGEVVSICILTMPENYYLMYAVNMLGGICNYIAVNNSVEEMRKKVANTGSKLVFTVNLSQENILEATKDIHDIKVISIPLHNSMPTITRTIIKRKIKAQNDSKVLSWNEFIKNGIGTSYQCPEVNGDTPAIIEYTSGTTGEAKGALHPNRTSNMIAYNYSHMGEEMIFNPGERFLNILPPFVAYGIFVGVHMPLCLGVEVYLCPSPEPAAVVKNFKKCKPHHFTGSPIHITALVEDSKIAKMNLSFLKTTACGGDIMSESWIVQVNQFFAARKSKSRIIVGYGMTESAGTFCTGTQKTDGMMPFPKNNIKVLEVDTGIELKFNETGEVHLSGPTIMDGYYGRDNLTDEVIAVDSDGTRWLKTGDLGYVTEEGFLVINGRLKRIYWTIGDNGEASRVYPMKIEQVIATHKSVAQVAVVGIKNKDKGYLTFAMLVLSGKERKEEIIQEIKELCKKKLDKSSWPFRYRVVDALPRTAASKIDYKQIEDMLTNQ